MKRTFLKLTVVAMLIVSVCALLVACNNDKGNNNSTFGMFSYRGVYLTSYKNADISETQAKDMITTAVNEEQELADSLNMATATEEVVAVSHAALVEEYLAKYKSITVTSRFWTEDEKGEIVVQEYTDEILGSDFKSVLENNQIAVSTGIVVPNILIYKEKIDAFEVANEAFKQQENYNVSPFKDLYTYHKNDTNFVLRTHFFVEISSSQIGGASCSYIQENESMYFMDGRMTKFQSSLGTKLQTKMGTQCEGTIFEILITWNEKA